MARKETPKRLRTGVRNLDEIIGGGLPRGSVVIINGPPGSGKTTLAQQISFHNAAAKQRVLYFGTLSEPTAKILRYMKEFKYFDRHKLDNGIEFVDLGEILHGQGLGSAFDLIMAHIKRVQPAIVVIDSFKAFNDLADSAEEFRKFGYQIAVNLLAWEITGFLVGEYWQEDMLNNPLFSIADGVISLWQAEASGEQQRFLRVLKLRGTSHSLDAHTFTISRDEGIAVFAPRITMRRSERTELQAFQDRCQTGIGKLDTLIGGGIARGMSVLVGGVAGTGKTALLLEFIYQGARIYNEKGILFSFEETRDRLLAMAAGLGWDLAAEIARGMIEIVAIGQPDIQVDAHMQMMSDHMAAMGAKRMAVDSASVFLYKVSDRQVVQEKIYQLCSIVQNNGAVGFFAIDIPYGAHQISRFGVEETIADGVILLTASEEGTARQRYIEIYKLRGTGHLEGRHDMVIGQGGITIYPRYRIEAEAGTVEPAIDIHLRRSTGIPRLDAIIGGGLLDRSVTLVSGSPGTGKTTLALQFVLEGAKSGQRCLFITLDEARAEVLATAEAIGLPVADYVKRGLVTIDYVSQQETRVGQFLSVLSDRIQALGAQRVVIDGTSFIDAGPAPQGLQTFLHALSIRFKALGTTSLFTLDSPVLYSVETVALRDLSPIADNLILLRYTLIDDQLAPTLTVIKTRGSWHDRHTFYYTLGQGGLHLHQPTDQHRATPPPDRRDAA